MGYRLILTLFVVTNFAFSQNKPEEVAKLWYQSYYQKNFQKVLECSYPEIFNVIEKNELLDIIHQSYDNENFSMSYMEEKVNFQFSKEFDLAEGKFIIVSFPLRVIVQQKSLVKAEEIEAYKEFYKNRMVAENVSFDVIRNSFIIEKTDMQLLVKNEHTDEQWKIIQFDPKKKGFVQIFFGDTFLEKLGF